MAGVHLKSIGRIFLLFILISVRAFAVEVKTELSDTTIYAGDSAALKIMISGSTSDIKPVKVPGVMDLEIAYTGSSRSFQFINGDVWSGVILNFRITSDKPGLYKIPSFTLQADGREVKSSPVTLRVLKGQGNTGKSLNGRVVIRSSVEFSRKNVRTGEPLLMRYYILSSSDGRFEINGMEKPPAAKGFVVKEIDEKRPDTVEKAAGTDFVKRHVATYCLIPTEAGNYSLGGGSGIITVNDEDSFFNFGQRKRIVFPVHGIVVESLPSSGKPAVYGGDVGQFTVSVKKPEGELHQFDEIRIEATVKGSGNIITLSNPHIGNSEIKVIFEKTGEEFYIDDSGITGSKHFNISVVPQKAGRLDLGRVSLSFYNPSRHRYETAESEPLVLNILPGRESQKGGEVKFDQDKKKLEIDFRIIAGICAGVVILFFGLFFERKRISRYFGETGTIDQDNSNGGRSLASSEHQGKTVAGSGTVPENGGRAAEQTASANVISESIDINSDITLKDIEKILKLINTDSLPESERSLLKMFRELVDSARYGCGELTSSDRERITGWLKKNKNRL